MGRLSLPGLAGPEAVIAAVKTGGAADDESVDDVERGARGTQRRVQDWRAGYLKSS